MAIMRAMDTIPALCCTCRFGTMIPAMVAATRTSVFWCRQGVPRVADRSTCPCYARGSPLEISVDPRSGRVSTATAADRPVTGSGSYGDPGPTAQDWGGALTPSG